LDGKTKRTSLLNRSFLDQDYDNGFNDFVYFGVTVFLKKYFLVGKSYERMTNEKIKNERICSPADECKCVILKMKPPILNSLFIT